MNPVVTELNEHSQILASPDSVEFECHQREVKNELRMKQVQLEQLRKELGSVNLIIHKSSTLLQELRTIQDEKRNNLSIVKEGVLVLEDKAKQLFVSEPKSYAGTDSMVKDNEKLKERVNQLQNKKSELTMELENKSKQYEMDMRYQKELMKEQFLIKTLVNEVINAATQAQNDQAALLERSCENIQFNLENLVGHYKTQCEGVSIQKSTLAKQLIDTQSAIDTIKNTMKTSARVLPASAEEIQTMKAARKRIQETADELKHNDAVIQELKRKIEHGKRFLLECQKHSTTGRQAAKDVEAQTETNKRGLLDYVVKEITITADVVEILD